MGLQMGSPLGVHQALPVPGFCTQMVLIGIYEQWGGLEGGGTLGASVRAQLC